jgi:succinate--hydroxymethylglutarate CoA-transferase
MTGLQLTGPLEGVKVLEIADGMAGPYLGLLLSDLGADVVKLETPEGDRSRTWRGEYGEDASIPYFTLNRGKRSSVVDLAEAADTVRLLTDGVDVVIVDSDALTAWPHLRGLTEDPANIVCRISQFGHGEPWDDAPLGELSAQLLSEATSSVGVAGQTMGRAGVDIGSAYSGIYGVQAVCAALYAHEEGGPGELIEVSLVGSLVAMRSTLWVALSNPDEWWGFHLESYTRPPYRGYQCADGAIYFDLRHAASVDWDSLLAALGLTHIKEDPRWPDLMLAGHGPGSRYAPQAQPVWESAFRQRSVEEVTKILTEHGGDVFAVNDYEQLLASEQVAVTGNVAPATETEPGYIRPPWEFSETPCSDDLGRIERVPVETLLKELTGGAA